MGNETFIKEHTLFCPCGHDEKMMEFIVTLPDGTKRVERQCHNCKRKWIVGKFDGYVSGVYLGEEEK